MWSVFKDIFIPEGDSSVRTGWQVHRFYCIIDWCCCKKKKNEMIEKWISYLPQTVVEFIQARFNLQSTQCSRVKYHPLNNTAELWQHALWKIMYDIKIKSLIMSIQKFTLTFICKHWTSTLQLHIKRKENTRLSVQFYGHVCWHIRFTSQFKSLLALLHKILTPYLITISNGGPRFPHPCSRYWGLYSPKVNFYVWNLLHSF